MHCQTGKDYRRHQYPKDFSNLIYSYVENHEDEDEVTGWISKQLLTLGTLALEGFIFGSFLINTKSANDVDLAILVSINDLKNEIQMFETLKQSFYVEFSKVLHLKVFNFNENRLFNSFKTNIIFIRELDIA